MRKVIAAIRLSIKVATSAMAQNKNYPKAKVSFDDFKGLVTEVEPHRASRLIDLDHFLKMSQEPGSIIFDSRSIFRSKCSYLHKSLWVTAIATCTN